MAKPVPEERDKTKVGAPAHVDFDAVPPTDADLPALPTSDMPSAIDGHKLIREIGRGGMGVVYLAREEKWGREVALKVVPAGMAPRQLRRFLEEATITGQLQHPVIVPVYRIGKTAKGRDYYTMKRVQGQTLSSILLGLRNDAGRTGERFGVRRRASILLSICEGVAYAHDRGIIHRDLKPSNIMIGDYGEVYVLDWGLAKVLFGAQNPDAFLEGASALSGFTGGDSSESQASKRTVSGTPTYMSPEQARGDKNAIDKPSDVWSLGAILYAMLTLHPPINAKETDQQLIQAARGEITPPEEYSGGRNAPKELLEIALKALKLEAMDRYANAREMAEDLRAYLDGRGRWQLDYEWVSGGAKPKSDDWIQVQGEWLADRQGLFPNKRTGKGSVLLFNQRFFGDVRLEIMGEVPPFTSVPGEMGIFLCAPDPDPGRNSTDGYCLEFGADENLCIKVAKNDVDVLVKDCEALKPGNAYMVAGEKMGNRIRMEVDGEEVFSFSDIFPLPGKRIGLYGWDPGIRIKSIRIFRRRLDAKISCLAIPDRDFERGRYTDALSGYLRIAEEFSGWEEGWLARFKAGLSRLQADDPLGAEAEFKRLVGSQGEYLAHLGRSLLSASENDHRRELMRLGAARRVSKGTSAQAHVLARIRSRANTLYSQHNYSAAISFYKELLEGEYDGGKRRIQARYRICDCYLRLGFEDEAFRHLKLMSKEPHPFINEFNVAYESIINYFIKVGKWDLGLKVCDLLSGLEENQARAWGKQAEIAWARGQTEEATKALAKGLKAKPDSMARAMLLSTQARMDLDQGRLREAQMVFKEAIGLIPGHPLEETFTVERAWIYAMLGKGERALASMARYMNGPCAPARRLYLLLVIGQLSRVRGQFDYARECLLQARDNLAAESSDLHKKQCDFELGLIHLAKKETTEGFDAFRRVQSQDNSGVTDLLTKTCLLWQVGEPLPEPPQTSQHFPWDRQSAYFYYLGEFARHSGRLSEARRAFGRATIETASPYRLHAWLSCLCLKEMNVKLRSTLPKFPPIG